MANNGTNKRPRYFDGQYLQDTDFSDEQRYHRDRQHRHSRLLQVAGIAEGLAWLAPAVRPSETNAKGLTVTVSAGSAIDAQGRQIVLLADRANVPLLDTADGVQMLCIQYAEQESKQDLQDGTATRTEEIPELTFVSASDFNAEEHIAIAELTLAEGKITQLNLDVRQYSGLKLPSADNAKAPILKASSRHDAPQIAELTGDLSVSGAIRAGSSSLYFTNAEHKHSGIGNPVGHAAIENAKDHDALMILGRSGTAKGRQVRLWDYLQVNGSLDVTGKVGIGTDTPSAKLEVNGDIKTNVALISHKPHTTAYAGFSHKDQGTGTSYGLLQQNTGETFLNAAPGRNLRFRIGNVDKMIVTSTGTVGIRVTNPTLDLAIGDSDTGLQQQGDGQLAMYTNSTEKLRVTPSGNVGIGTTAPSTKLEVNGDIKTNVALISDYTHGTAYAAFSHKDQGTAGGYALLQQNTGETFLNAAPGRNLRFRIDNADKMIVTSTGKVGIRVNNPTLDLAIGDSDTGLQQQGDGQLAMYTNSRERLRVASSGNVGIGTTQPSAKLDVRGAIHAGNSDLYFTHTQHNHSGFGNTTGYAAIENSKNYDALMILGRAGTNKGRKVKLYDYVEVHGSLDVTGTIYVRNLPYRDRKNMQYDHGNKEFCYDNSSRKSKRDILPLVDDFSKILRISPKTYTRPDDPNHWEIGCIAEDFDELGLGNLVYYEEDGTPGSINYRKISLYLVEVVKNIHSRINAYEGKIKQLEESIL